MMLTTLLVQRQHLHPARGCYCLNKSRLGKERWYYVLFLLPQMPGFSSYDNLVVTRPA